MRVEPKEEHSQKYGNGGKQENPSRLPMLPSLSPKAVPSGTMWKHGGSLHEFFGKGNINVRGGAWKTPIPLRLVCVDTWRFSGFDD